MADRASKLKHAAASPEAGLRSLARAWAQEEGRALLAERDELNRQGPSVLLPRADARVKGYLRARRRRRTWTVVAACLAVYLALPQALIAARDAGLAGAAGAAMPSAAAKAVPAPSSSDNTTGSAAAPVVPPMSEPAAGGGAAPVSGLGTSDVTPSPNDGAAASDVTPSPQDTVTAGAPAPMYSQAPSASGYVPPMPAPQPWWLKLLDILWPWGKLFDS